MSSLPRNCEIFVTQDGSPTLLWTREDGYAEKMHHSGGALSESFYIYHEALLDVISREWPVRVLSIGLGLGYNELIAIGEMHRRGLTDWRVSSFETEDFLREGFKAWLAGENCGPLGEVLDAVASGVAGRFAITAMELKTAAHHALKSARLELRRGFPEDAKDVGGCTCVFYDAYSKKMNPELWIEDDLLKHLQACIAETCVLTTYAATGSLNRALKRLAFRLTPRTGFLGKRESTLAIRG
jgi:tRNA U34 5-methylaminomethyl-2-thiouridine-forming methyltransferase MnmC